MSLRETLNVYKNRFKKRARRVIGDKPSSGQSTDSLPVQNSSSSTNPAPGSLAVLTASDPIPRPVSAPPSNEQTGFDHTWTCFKGFLRVLDKGSNVLGPLKIVMDDLVQCFALHEDAAAARQDYAALKAQLEAVFSDLSHHFSGNVPASLKIIMENFCKAIERELDSMANKEERQAWKRHFEAKKDLDEVMGCYRRIHGHLDRLNLNANINTWKTVDELATDGRLKALNPSMSARYDSAQASKLGRRKCTPKTREEVLTQLRHWRYDKTQGNLFWLNGMAGTGKTTIASTLCTMLENSSELGASFFCTRLLPECRDVNMILPSIAYQLAQFSPPFRLELSQSLESHPDTNTLALPKQLENLIVNPLRQIAHTLPTDLVVVIDALDECEDSDLVGEMLEMLAGHSADLPIKIFVSSRPEPQIRERIGDVKSKLVLHELDDKIVKEDIETYLRAELAYMSLAEPELAALVERAGVLFIYAATVVRYLGAATSQSSRKNRLKTVLAASAPASSKRNENIDALYNTVLEHAFSNSDLEDEDQKEMKLVLDTVICAQEPLTVDALSELLQLGHPDRVHAALRPLWSVLHISGTNNIVTTLHASFPDYMLDPKRSDKHGCQKQTHHGRLAELCFERIDRNQPQFNICGLESSYLSDDQVEGLEERVKQAIPLSLLYACQYWAVHLELGGWSTNRIQPLENFLTNRLLLWMEVLNLKKRMNIGAVSLEKARKWCTDGGGSEALRGLIHDAWRFVTTFATNPVSHSTPHIYVSMLPFWPSPTLIANYYIKRARGLAEVKGSGMTRRQLSLLGMFAVGSGVYSVAFSPDGMRIICGCHDNTISVWDVRSGKMVLGPLKGHTEEVNSVAFSPDGQRIASGSNDIRLWDARSGKMALEPLEGHTDWVRSVAFSPDCTRVVSGSDDRTIRVWDVQSGQTVLGPLKGHTDSVESVAFSPDGTRIVSGSWKTTVVWDSQSGQVAMGPLKGHTGPVFSVAFSPDGDQIVSGGERTIRVWDSRNGKPMIEPLEGHTADVTAVAFSPDGAHIVSGSQDKTIRLWDARGGKLVLGPLEGHTVGVTSVAFSPDGMRIVSGSYDQTIHVWDAQSREVASGPSEGHTESINSVVFAPDGMRIVSGSADKTIRVWDLQNGKMVLGPLEGHTQSVLAVAFSPNGTLIASGSTDETIRVWDAQTGKMVPGPRMGHTSWVYSVAFSPDSTCVVSVSYQTIHVWDAQTGKELLGPLEGHTDAVLSVVFSPDGTRIVSGSEDRTVWVWDARNGEMVLGPLKGHSDTVGSVAFSPNGKRIASGSHDETLRLWDAQSGNMVLEPLEGHTGGVSSVAFSPNGLYIVSGSYDKTIRVWAAETGELVLGPLNGHTQGIFSISFSPDGTHIVSGSEDKAIRVWRLPSRLLAANPEPATPSREVPDSPIPLPSISHKVPSDTPFQWLLTEEGWVVDEHAHLWLWVPPDLRASLIMPQNTLLISPQGSVQINFQGAADGESWTDRYSPT